MANDPVPNVRFNAAKTIKAAALKCGVLFFAFVRGEGFRVSGL